MLQELGDFMKARGFEVQMRMDKLFFSLMTAYKEVFKNYIKKYIIPNLIYSKLPLEFEQKLFYKLFFKVKEGTPLPEIFELAAVLVCILFEKKKINEKQWPRWQHDNFWGEGDLTIKMANLKDFFRPLTKNGQRELIEKECKICRFYDTFLDINHSMAQSSTFHHTISFHMVNYNYYRFIFNLHRTFCYNFREKKGLEIWTIVH